MRPIFFSGGVSARVRASPEPTAASREGEGAGSRAGGAGVQANSEGPGRLAAKPRSPPQIAAGTKPQRHGGSRNPAGARGRRGSNWLGSLQGEGGCQVKASTLSEGLRSGSPENLELRHERRSTATGAAGLFCVHMHALLDAPRFLNAEGRFRFRGADS